jgi:putative transcriptional regulator
MKGRINWALIRSHDEATIVRLAAEERAAHGIDLTKLHFHRPFDPRRSPNVKTIRRSLGLTQSEFAKRFRLSQRTVQQWEQGRSKPDQPARNLLRVIELAPQVVARAVDGAGMPRKRPK